MAWMIVHINGIIAHTVRTHAACMCELRMKQVSNEVNCAMKDIKIPNTWQCVFLPVQTDLCYLKRAHIMLRVAEALTCIGTRDEPPARAWGE